MRATGGIINTAIIQAASIWIVASRDLGLLREHGGHIETTIAAKYLIKQTGYVKRMRSNAGKIAMSHHARRSENNS